MNTGKANTNDIRIIHYWPGRAWKGHCPIPANLVREADRMGSERLTVAVRSVVSPGGYMTLEAGAAYCRHGEQKRLSVDFGRKLATARLLRDSEEVARLLKSLEE